MGVSAGTWSPTGGGARSPSAPPPCWPPTRSAPRRELRLLALVFLSSSSATWTGRGTHAWPARGPRRRGSRRPAPWQEKRDRACQRADIDAMQKHSCRCARICYDWASIKSLVVTVQNRKHPPVSGPKRPLCALGVALAAAEGTARGCAGMPRGKPVYYLTGARARVRHPRRRRGRHRSRKPAQLPHSCICRYPN